MKPISFLVSGLLYLFGHRRAFVEVHPQHRELLKQHGLNDPEDYFDLPAIIVSGHPNRHVACVKLGSGQSRIAAYLKREHRLPWRDRLTNAWAGFGWCSKSYREALLLRAMRQEGVSCPEFLAVGEDGRGRAFLLIRELAECVDLRVFLRAGHLVHPETRRRFARELGEALARLHDAGFDHPDLYSKHVFVNPRGSRVSLLDCQRSQRHPTLSWWRRWHDLAALDATLSDDLVPPRERLWCLRGYLRAALASPAPKPFFRQTLATIRRQASRLLRHRHIRELRQPPLKPDAQNLIWVRGESVCVTRDFHEALQGQIPERLLLGRQRPFSDGSWGARGSKVTCCRHSFRGVGAALLIQRRTGSPFLWLWAKLRRWRWVSPELEQAGVIFRLERYGVRCARLLAFGQSQFRPWQQESFLLIQDSGLRLPLRQWMEEHAEVCWTAQRKQRWRLLRELGTLLRGMHQAHCYLPADSDDSPVIENTGEEGLILLLASVERICKRRRPNPTLAKMNLTNLMRTLSLANLSRTDRLRILMSYVGTERLSTSTKRVVKDFVL